MGGTLSDFHRTEGEKEWGVHCFSPSVRWGKTVGGTLFLLSAGTNPVLTCIDHFSCCVSSHVTNHA